MTTGLGKYLESYLKPIGSEPTKPSKPPSEPKKEVLKVLMVPTMGVSVKKSCHDDSRKTGTLGDETYQCIHLTAIRRISRVYREGALQFTKANHPELDAKIRQSENVINKLWLDVRKSGDYSANLPRFRKLIREHARLQIQAIRLFRDETTEPLEVNSKAVGETVYFADSSKAAEGKVPQGAIVYTRDELRRLVAVNPAPEELKLVHSAKKKFSGTIGNDGGHFT